MEKNVLGDELKTYEYHKANLLKSDRGKFVLIKENKIVGVYDTYDDAVKVGIDKFGNRPFLVKQILDVEPKENFTSNLINLA